MMSIEQHALEVELIELVASFPWRRSFLHWPRWRAIASYECGVVRKRQTTPWQNVGGDARDHCVFWSMRS